MGAYKDCNTNRVGGRGDKKKKNLKSLVLLFVEVFFRQFSRHARTECDRCQKGDNSIATEPVFEKQCWPKGFLLTWGMQIIRVCAEE